MEVVSVPRWMLGAGSRGRLWHDTVVRSWWLAVLTFATFAFLASPADAQVFKPRGKSAKKKAAPAEKAEKPDAPAKKAAARNAPKKKKARASETVAATSKKGKKGKKAKAVDEDADEDADEGVAAAERSSGDDEVVITDDDD